MFEGTEPSADTVRVWKETSQRNYGKLTSPQQEIIGKFVHSEYAAIRALQEGKAVYAIEDLPGVWQKAPRIRELQALLPELERAQRALAFDHPTQFGPLYRGLKLTPAELEKLLTWQEFAFDAKSNSTSFSYETAKDFASALTDDRRKVVLRIKSVRQGAFVGFAENTNAAETEVIVSNRKFKITGKTTSTLDGVTVIDLEETAESALRLDETVKSLTKLSDGAGEQGKMWSDGSDISGR